MKRGRAAAVLLGNTTERKHVKCLFLADFLLQTTLLFIEVSFTDAHPTMMSAILRVWPCLTASTGNAHRQRLETRLLLLSL